MGEFVEIRIDRILGRASCEVRSFARGFYREIGHYPKGARLKSMRKLILFERLKRN